jgi:signal transduction histidine kinase
MATVAAFLSAMPISENVERNEGRQAQTAERAALSADGPAEHRGPPPATSVFARKMAHDLNNFATVVRTYSELLLAELPAGSTRDDVNEIHRAADAMVVYLQRVTRFARANTQRPAPTAVLPLVSEVVSEFAEARDRAPVQLLGITEAIANVDPFWMRDVVRELVKNGRTAALASSVVTVEVREETDPAAARWVVVDVRDQGPGFAPDVDGSAEDPFVTSQAGVRGAGFGLTLAAVFAESSGGRLVRSHDDGVTSVALWLRVHGG